MARYDQQPATIEASVVIPARNAAATIGDCLQALFRSAGVRLEVIVVDDASTDGTADIARRQPCRVVRVARPIMAANARNLGAEHARGEVLVFVDADEVVLPETVARFVDALRRHPDVDAVVGSLTAATPAPGFFSRFKNLQHHVTHHTAATEGSTLDSGRMAIRRAVFHAIGGFEPAFAGASIEDIALGYRMRKLGHRIRFEPGIQLVHLKHYTFLDMVRSDILHRAIPWTGLMLRERVFRNDLNTRSGNIASVALACAVPAAMVAGLAGLAAGWVLAAVAAVAVVALNGPLVRAARAAYGLRFAVLTAAFLPLMYLYHGLGLVLGVGAYFAGRSVARPRTRPVAEYAILEPDAESPGGPGT